MRISNPKDMGGNKLLHRVNVATGGVIQGEGTETSPLVANVDAIASNVFPDFSGNSGKVLMVNANETGTEWVAMQSGGSSSMPDISSLKVVRTISSEEEFESLAEEVKESVKDIAFLATPGTTNTGWSAQNGYVVPGHSYLLVPFHLEYSYQVQWTHFVVTSRYWKCTLKGGSCELNGVLKTLRPGKGEEAYSTGTYGTSWDATRPSDTLILRETIDTKPLYISDTEKIIVGTNGEVDSNGNLTLVGDYYKNMGGGWEYTGASVRNIKCDYDIEYYTSGHWKDSTTVNVDIRDYFLFDLTLFYTSCAVPTFTQAEALEIKPGQQYAWTLNTDSTLNAVSVSAGLWASAQIDIAPGAHTVTAGNNLTIVDALTTDAVNICEARWRNGSARLKVVDVITEGSGGGTTEGTITASSQTITGTAGTSLSYNLASYVTVSNGQTPTFTLASGQVLPEGLSLSSSGVISGTTNVTGTTTTSVKVSASNCPDVEMTVTFNIAESTPQGTITVTTNPVTIQGVVGTAIDPYNLSSFVTVSNGMTPSFSWTEEYITKPSWLNLTATGVLSGTPSSIPSPNAGKVTVSADNCNSAYIDITWDIINAGTITIDNQTIDGTVGNAVSLNLSSSTTVSNGQTPTFAVKSGNTLPVGIELSSAGVLSGTPTATSSATVVITITARGCPDKEVSITFNITEEQGGETPSDGWPTKIVVSNASCTDGGDVSAFNGEYTRTGETLSVLGENVPIWSNGSKYIYGIASDTGIPATEPLIALFDSTGNDDTFFCYYYRKKSEASWKMGAGNSMGLTVTITEVSGGESSSSSSGSEEPAPSDGWPTTITVSDATATNVGSSWSDEWNGTYTRTGDTTTALGETIPVWSNGKYYVNGYGTYHDSALPEVGIGFFIGKNYSDRWNAYFYRAKSATTWTRGAEADGPGLTMTITEDPISGGESSSSSSESSGESGGGTVTFPDSFSVTSCSYNGAAVGQYTKTSEKTTVNGVDYPVYSMTDAILGTTFYVFVCDKFNGTSGAYWALNGDSEYSSSMDGNTTLGSVVAGSDGLPSSTTWTSANGTATVSWT